MKNKLMGILTCKVKTHTTWGMVVAQKVVIKCQDVTQRKRICLA